MKKLPSFFSRRSFLTLAGIGLAAASSPALIFAKDQDNEVTAVEDLMREHGILRRILIIYRGASIRLRKDPASISAKTLHDAATFFKNYGEDYHERAIEEAYVFPAVRTLPGVAGAYADILIAQHNRGREITNFILANTARDSIDPARVADLAQNLENMATMYENHAAREDTIVFPAWKDSLSMAEYDALSDRFDAIERERFGTEEFKKALQTVASLEQAMGYASLSRFTAPPP